MKKFNLAKCGGSKGPNMDTLKKNRTTLSEEERKEIVDKGAVWEDNDPAVWKAVVDGKDWYVCNTHRAFQCKSTLKGAIKAFDFIETTSISQKELKIAGRKRIKDRGINWKEKYHEKSVGLKKKFDSEIGHNAYMRFEGHDYTTNSDYFVVVGPAVTNDLKKRYFAGVKKLPDDPQAKVYAPSGEYFSTVVAAYSHASEKWGIQFPKGVAEYNLSHLANIDIPRHVKG